MPARLQMVLSWVLILGLGGLAVWGYVEAVQADPAVVGSVGTAVLGVFGVLWQQRASERARLRESRRARMTPIYDGLLGLVVGGMGVSREESGNEEEARAQSDERGGGDAQRGDDRETEEFMRDLRGGSYSSVHRAR